MKRILTAACLILVVAFAATGCTKDKGPNTIKDGKKLSDVVSAVDEKFAEKYGDGFGAVAMPYELDEAYLKDFLYLNPEDVSEYAGSYSMSMTNSDAFLAIHAKEGKADLVKEGLEKRRQDLLNQYEQYPVNGSYERAKTGEVYQKGDYLFLIVVGVMPEDPDAALTFDQDVLLVKDTIDSMFQ